MEAPRGYRLIQPLDEGGLKEVYEAEDVYAGQRVALKCFKCMDPAALARIAATEGTDIDGLRRRDARQAALNHPGILRASWFFDQNGTFWIREELFERTLAQVRASDGHPGIDSLSHTPLH